VDVISISAAARGADEKAPEPVEMKPDDVLELELEDGTRLLVAAEDAERYLGKTIKRDGDDSGAIHVGPALRLSGAHLPHGAARDGVGTWVLRALRIFRTGPVGMTALAAAGSIQDHQLDHRNGLFRLSADRWELTSVQVMPPSAEPVLLFLHGTISSTEGSFGKLWESDARRRIVAAYGERIYGFEHRTLTDSPVANALALVAALPVGGRLHLVSHSRGGIVGELLARANRTGDDAFSVDDVERFNKQAESTGRKGYEQEMKDLLQLGKLLKEKSIKVERFVRVAGPLRGTTLLSGRLDRWASVTLNLLGLGLKATSAAVPVMSVASKGYDLVQKFLLAVVKERTDARIMPGLEAMMPDSPLVAMLNAPEAEVDFSLHVIAGDYRGDGLLSWLGDYLSESFYGGQTDLVVNTPSMSGGAARLQGIWLKSVAGPKVHHLSYFERDESATPLVDALTGRNNGFEKLAAPSTERIARGGKENIPKPDAPIALMLPGIMGTQLGLGDERIWFNPFRMIVGGISKLKADTEGVNTFGWIDGSYERFSKYLAQSYEVRPFVYDWRLSLQDAAARFDEELVKAMAEAKLRKKPLRIVAHSMGGLVARLALKNHWTEFKSIPGSRLVQFGTPNMGSHSIALVLMGRDGFIQKIERWADLKNNMKEFLDTVRDYPGVLELLPWTSESDGIDYFDPKTWEDWAARDAENRSRTCGDGYEKVKGAGDGWLMPRKEKLLAARATVELLLDAKVDTECTLYVAGSQSTPIKIRLEGDEVEAVSTPEGDGRVPWKTGKPDGVPIWYVDAAHGDLLDHVEAFEQYVKLLETGDCDLAKKPIGSRDGGGAVFMPMPRQTYGLYPTAEEVLAAALCGRNPNRKDEKQTLPAVIKIIHGNFAAADTPILMGAYANDPLRGSAHFLDRHLQGSLGKAQDMGRYPNQPGEVMVFLRSEPNAKPGGAIVVGLGAVGELKPGALTRTLTHGLMEYARIWEQQQKPDNKEPIIVNLSAVLVGTGHAALSVELGMRGLVDAIRRAGQLFAHAKMTVRIGSVTLYEEEETRVIAAAEVLSELVRDKKNLGIVSYDGQIRSADGAYRGRCTDTSGTRGWYRVHITSGAEDGQLRFTLVTDRARNEVSEEPDQHQAVDGLIRSATTSTADQPGLSRALFELMVPNGLKESLHDVRGLILGVDASAAVYPWELMRDEAERFESPLATRVGIVRQLASPQGRMRVPTVEKHRILVVGDTQSGLLELLGAQQEGKATAELYRNRGYEDEFLQKADGQSVLINLFDGEYKIIHLAAHGTVADENDKDKKGHTGMVLGKDTYLTTAQISKLRHVPELVFINCCHLGSMKEDARPRWGKLAANLATEFIEMGCKAVIAAGWAVDDAAAETFAKTFHTAMLDNKPFGEAVLTARNTTWQRHPSTNTWGAYQAYGDERYRLNKDADKETEKYDYIHVGQIISDLDQLHARIKSVQDKQEKVEYQQRLEQIEIAARTNFFQYAAIRERLGAAWADFDDKGRAIEHYCSALVQEDGLSSLKSLEQLANLEVRHGEALMKEEKSRKQGDVLMKSGLKRLKSIVSIGETVERLSLLGSSYKRRAQALHATGKTKEIPKVLEEMTEAYTEAVKLSLHRDGERDYYPLLNAMDGIFLLATWGKNTLMNEQKKYRAILLEEAIRNGQHRFESERTYFHALSKVDAARVNALWACFDGRDGESITQQIVLNALAVSYRDVHTRLGNPREKNSALNQIDVLVELMNGAAQYESIRNALSNLREA
jgi:pimeloyl-ACP methyl ester carboxylesterase